LQFAGNIFDMKSNVGSADRVVRIILAAVILALYMAKIFTGTLAIVLLAVAAILLLTSFISFCPIWHILGINTKKKIA